MTLKNSIFSRETIAPDALASLVVFLVALPLCMGIAIASGAPPAAGLITGIIGGLVVGSISGCPLQVSGPAAGLAVLVYELIKQHGFAMLGPIVVLAGVIQIVAGALKAGQLFRSIAPAVVYGMLAGIGVLIFAAQFHVMMDDAPRENGIQNLLAIPEAVYKGVFPLDGTAHHLAAAMGIMTIAVLLLWTRFAPPKVRWVPGALVGVIVATVTARVLGLPIKYVDIPDSLLGSITLPGMDTFARLADWHMLIAAVTLAFVASAETLLSATAVDQMHDGPRTNYDREMISQGVGNTLAGLFGGLPMTGVIVRSATNVNAGAKTRASAIMHGVWLLMMVAAAPMVLRLVPTASLAAVLVYTGYKLVNPANIRKLFEYGGMPVLIYGVTITMIVVTDLLTGIICGLLIALANVVYALTHMSVKVSRERAGACIDVHLEGAATFIRMPALIDALDALPHHAEVHIHIRDLSYIDHACLDGISCWAKQRNQKDAKTVMEWGELMAKYRQPMSDNRQARLQSDSPWQAGVSVAQAEPGYYSGVATAEVVTVPAFQRVMVVHTAEYPDVPLLEFAALMARGSQLTVAAYPSDDVLRILPSTARRCAEARGSKAPKVVLLTEPDIESAFASASEAKADLLIMRQPQHLPRWTVSHADCSLCFVPSNLPAAISKMLLCIDLNADGKHLMAETSRLYRALDADEILALHVYCSETVDSHESVRAERMKQVQHFVHRAGQPGVCCTPLLEESVRPYRTFARVATEREVDLVVVGRRMGEFSFDKGQFMADCGAPVLQLLLPKASLGWRDRLRRVFSNQEPTFG